MNKHVCIKLILFLAIAIFSYSCISDKNEKEEEVDSLDLQSEVELQRTQTTYKLPSPIELYIFIEDQGKDFDAEVLNSVENVSRYNTRRSKALNFGVYASDLGYCAVYRKSQPTVTYYKTAKTLADDIGLVEGFNETIAKRIEKNIHNLDSLFEITSDAYWDACTHLEAQGKQDLLSLITVGSWLESVHIAFQSAGKFSNNDLVVERIAEQYLLLENLLDYLNSLDPQAQDEEIIQKLMDIQESYDKLYDNPDDVLITRDQYNEIHKKIEALRAEIIS